MALVGAGLCYDALIMALGSFIGLPLLPLLSKLRFISHGMLIPLNLIICAYALPLRRKPLAAAWVVTGIVMAVGAAAGVCREIAPAEEIGGIVRYVSVSPKDAWMERVNSVLSYGSVLPVIAVGIVVLIRQKTPSLLLAGVLMFLFAALGPATGNFDLIFLISMFGELFLILFFLIYERRHAE